MSYHPSTSSNNGRPQNHSIPPPPSIPIQHQQSIIRSQSLPAMYWNNNNDDNNHNNNTHYNHNHIPPSSNIIPSNNGDLTNNIAPNQRSMNTPSTPKSTVPALRNRSNNDSNPSMLHLPTLNNNKTMTKTPKNDIKSTPLHQIDRNRNITQNAPKKITAAPSRMIQKMKLKPVKRIKLKSTNKSKIEIKSMATTMARNNMNNNNHNHNVAISPSTISTCSSVSTSIHNSSTSAISTGGGGGGGINTIDDNNHNHNNCNKMNKYKKIKNNQLPTTPNTNNNITKTYKRQRSMDNDNMPKKLKMNKPEQIQKKPILMLPNIETPFNEKKEDKNIEITVNTKKRARPPSIDVRSKSLNNMNDKEPLRKKRKISLKVPKCKVGDTMECIYCDEDEDENENENDSDSEREEEWRLCTIIAIKSNTNTNRERMRSSFLYYIHYVDYNRRLDRWVNGDKLRKPTGKIKKPSELLLCSRNNQRLTRGQKRAVFEEHDIDINDDDIPRINNEDELYESIHLKTNKIKNIEKIQFGSTIIDCWYFSPYPEEYIGSTRLLYICEYCLKYMKFYNTYLNHINNQCFIRHPPGNEIYRYQGISVWEIDGCCDKIYCQNLCLLAKLFFDHKTLYFDVSPFLFYIVCEYKEYDDDDDDDGEQDGFHLIGYFSKEKNSPEHYNLACILTMPHKQKLGFGRFIISLSYELSKKEEKIGSPEKPLSDLGKISYKSYWIENILNIINDYYGEITIKQIEKLTCFTKQDIINSLKEVNMLNCYKGQYVIKYRPQSIKKYLNQFNKRKKLRKNIFDPQHLHWEPKIIKTKNHPWNGLSSFHK